MLRQFIEIIEDKGFVQYKADPLFWVNEKLNAAIGLDPSNEWWTLQFDDELSESGYGFDFPYFINILEEKC